MCRRASVIVGLALALCAFTPAPASANLGDTLCGLAGDIFASGPETGLCHDAAHPGRVIGIVKKVIGIGKKVGSGGGSATSSAGSALGLAAIVTWVVGGAAFALHETATLLGKTTNPELGAAWFSSTYLHMAAIATLLTLPFLFAAAVQALLRSDLAMLARAAFGYLPLAMLAIAIAAPLTTLLLAASDGLSGTIEQAAGGQGTHFLLKASLLLGVLTGVTHSPFVAFLIGFFVAAGALFLWLELVLREVAVYVIVLTLPLVFAAFVWPARRVWAIRAVELLMALILAKLAIVSVLALGAGALDHATRSLSIVSLLAGVALVTLGAFAPWVLVKLMPLGELAAAAAGPLSGHLTAARKSGEGLAGPWAAAGTEQAESIVAGMRRQATAADPAPEGADAEAARLADLSAESASREPDSPTDGSLGVAGGENPDPLRGTANPPGGPIPGAPGEPVPPGAPGEPALADATGTPSHPPQADGERGPAPNVEGLAGGEAFWRDDSGSNPHLLGPEGVPPSSPADDGDPRPPAQEPEDGRL